ncbi:MAG: hypothetical protein J5871_00025, partial [Bacteroidales bacterium]|nr:hypothetical protein [Bacteroidales bacterium]
MVADHALPYFATDKEVTTVKGKTYNKQEGYFFNPYLFAILNLHGLVDGYKPSRMYELSLYGGIGMMAGYYDPAQSAIYANHPEYNGRSYAVSGHFGILNTFRIAKNLKLFVLGHGAIVGEAFDNEKTPEVPFDGLFGLSAGLTYQFGK